MDECLMCLKCNEFIQISFNFQGLKQNKVPMKKKGDVLLGPLFSFFLHRSSAKSHIFYFVLFFFTDAAGETPVHPGRRTLRAGYIRTDDAVHRLAAQAVAVFPGNKHYFC